MLDVARHFFGVDGREALRRRHRALRLQPAAPPPHATTRAGGSRSARGRGSRRSAARAQVGGGAGRLLHAGASTRSSSSTRRAAASSSFPEIDMPGHVNAARRRVSGAVAAGARQRSRTPAPTSASAASTSTSERVLRVRRRRRARARGADARAVPAHRRRRGVQDPARAVRARSSSALCASVRAHGKQPIGWEEIAQTRLEPGTIVQHWKEPEHAREAVGRARA